MTRIEKLVQKFRSVPKDLTWEEFFRALNYFGYVELSGKGKTGGSRRKFVNKDKNNDVIIAHKPHPKNVVKKYIIEQAIEKIIS